MTTLKYSETFYSAQGEGTYIGIPSLWMRFFLCNLQCDGFGQDDPTDPSTYDLPYEKLDLTDITDVHQLPVFERGCDSSYTWSKRYRHLIQDRTVEEAVDELTALLPHGSFVHPHTGQGVDMVFTGGEPMLRNTQPGMVAILQEFIRRGNPAARVTVETNGTKPIIPELEEFIDLMHVTSEYGGAIDDNWPVTPEWFWSVSPKLWSTAGEKPSKAIKPEVVAEYAQASNRGHLKYVVNGSEESWREVEEHTQAFRDAGCNWPVWIMPEGATEEGQLGKNRKMSAGDIAHEALSRGYNVSPRVHVYLWGNVIGV